jgi:hypothetical protein
MTHILDVFVILISYDANMSSQQAKQARSPIIISVRRHEVFEDSTNFAVFLDLTGQKSAADSHHSSAGGGELRQWTNFGFHTGPHC